MSVRDLTTALETPLGVPNSSSSNILRGSSLGLDILLTSGVVLDYGQAQMLAPGPPNPGGASISVRDSGQESVEIWQSDLG